MKRKVFMLSLVGYPIGSHLPGVRHASHPIRFPFRFAAAAACNARAAAQRPPACGLNHHLGGSMKRIIATAIAGVFCVAASAADTSDAKSTYADIEATFGSVPTFLKV